MKRNVLPADRASCGPRCLTQHIWNHIGGKEKERETKWRTAPLWVALTPSELFLLVKPVQCQQRNTARTNANSNDSVQSITQSNRYSNVASVDSYLGYLRVLKQKGQTVYLSIRTNHLHLHPL